MRALGVSSFLRTHLKDDDIGIGGKNKIKGRKKKKTTLDDNN